MTHPSGEVFMRTTTKELREIISKLEKRALSLCSLPLCQTTSLQLQVAAFRKILLLSKICSCMGLRNIKIFSTSQDLLSACENSKIDYESWNNLIARGREVVRLGMQGAISQNPESFQSNM